MVSGFRFPQPENLTQPDLVLGYLNDTTNDLYGAVILLGIYVLIYILRGNFDKDSPLIAGLITATLAVLARLFGFVVDVTVVTFILLAALGALISIVGGDRT